MPAIVPFLTIERVIPFNCGATLLADLQDELPQGQADAIMKEVDNKISRDPPGMNAQSYGLECDLEDYQGGG